MSVSVAECEDDANVSNVRAMFAMPCHNQVRTGFFARASGLSRCLQTVRYRIVRDILLRNYSEPSVWSVAGWVHLHFAVVCSYVCRSRVPFSGHHACLRDGVAVIFLRLRRSAPTTASAEAVQCMSRGRQLRWRRQGLAGGM